MNETISIRIQLNEITFKRTQVFIINYYSSSKHD